MPRYIDADKLREVMERYDDYAVDIVDDAPTVDAGKIAVEYCMKHCLVMISMVSYETLIAYYGRRNGLLFDERIEDAEIH